MLSFAFRNSPSPIIKVFSPRSIWSSRCDRDGQADTHRHNAGSPGGSGSPRPPPTGTWTRPSRCWRPVRPPCARPWSGPGRTGCR